jgi:hypothetical protein
MELIDHMNALHEAGHAVMVVLTGGTVRFVYLADPAGAFSDIGCTKSSEESDPEKRILTVFAGIGAELIHREAAYWSTLFEGVGRGDWRNAQPLLREIGGNRRQIIGETKAEVTRLLSENWEWVNEVATLLQKERHINGEQVEACKPTKAEERAAWSVSPAPQGAYVQFYTTMLDEVRVQSSQDAMTTENLLYFMGHFDSASIDPPKRFKGSERAGAARQNQGADSNTLLEASAVWLVPCSLDALSYPLGGPGHAFQETDSWRHRPGWRVGGPWTSHKRFHGRIEDQVVVYDSSITTAATVEPVNAVEIGACSHA